MVIRTVKSYLIKSEDMPFAFGNEYMSEQNWGVFLQKQAGILFFLKVKTFYKVN